MNNVLTNVLASQPSRCLALAMTAFFVLTGCRTTCSQDIKVSITNYEGTSKKKVEYQYVSGRKAKVGGIEYRDDNTGLLTGIDLNTYALQEMVPHGYWKEYHLNGNLKAQYNFVDGMMEGAAKTFYENGTIQKQFNFKKGIIDGEFSEYYDDGILQSKIVYVNGMRTGSSTVYDPDKNPILFLTYSSPQVQSSSAVLIAGEKPKVARVLAQSKHSNGRIAEEGYLETYYSMKGFPFYYDDNFRREGIWKEFDENGVKVAETTYQNSNPDGLCTTFYPNGRKKEEMIYKPADYSGQAISIVDGPYRIYYENGQLAKVGTMKTLVTKSKTNADELETELYNAGDWRRYSESGKLIEFKSLGRGDELLCEMNESQIEEQLNISDQLEFGNYRAAMIDKFTKYIRFHYGEVIDNQNAVRVPENKAIFEEIRVEAMAVFNEYLGLLKSCNNKTCVSEYSSKLSNVLIKLDQARTNANLISLNQQIRQYGIKAALKI